MSDEDELDPEELREAEALARALERGSADPDLPDEAFQTAAFLRYSANGGALAKDREDAVLADVLAAADRAGAKGERATRPWPLWRWLFGIAGVAGATALCLLILATPDEPGAATALPAPDAALLETQIARLEGAGADARFDDAMRAYRGSVYAALEARYGER